MINPAALLPGAASSMSGTLSSSSGVSSSSLSPSPVSTPIGGHEESEGGVSFDTPVQVTTLQSAHKVGLGIFTFISCCILSPLTFAAILAKISLPPAPQGRAKGSALRRPQSRLARQQAAIKSVKDTDKSIDDHGPNPSISSLLLPSPDKSSLTTISSTSPYSSEQSTSPVPSQPSSSQSSSRPSELSLPVSTKAGRKDSDKDSSSTKKQPLLEEENLFGSDSFFGPQTVSNKPSARETPKNNDPQASSAAGLKKDKDPSTLPSIFDAQPGDLFQNIKPQSNKVKVSPFMEDDDDDLFGLNSATTTSKTNKENKNDSFATHDIFQVALPFYCGNSISVHLCYQSSV